MTDSAIARNRFGLGARPDDRAMADPARALLDQFGRFDPRPQGIAALPPRRQIATELSDYLEASKAFREGIGTRRPGMPDPLAGMAPMAAMGAMGGDDAQADGPDDDKDPIKQVRRFLRRQGRDYYATAVGARAVAALTTPTPFVERLVHFWANHFAVSADKLTVVGLAGLLEFEAIRPHVLGNFADMLGAVERHPAMLLYLDQAQSIGPNSPIGSRIAARGVRTVGLNENLAREILELHTLGVRTGYAQADVTEFARAMTGWTVTGLTRGPMARFVGVDGAPGDFVFAPRVHEPGTRTILGKRYAQEGERQAQAVLADLAVHPSTATHIATKLARHFTGDVPPPAMVGRMAAAFLGSGGDLPTLYRALILSPEAWVATAPKFKTPWDWSISAMRGIGLRTVEPQAITGLMNQLGQPVWRPGSPAGFDDMTASWAGPDAVMRRVEAAERMATRVAATVDARATATALFGDGLSAATGSAIARAESPAQALALLLVSPEFMRR